MHAGVSHLGPGRGSATSRAISKLTARALVGSAGSHMNSASFANLAGRSPEQIRLHIDQRTNNVQTEHSHQAL